MSNLGLRFILIAVVSAGCTSSNRITREELAADQSHSIVVQTYDGRTIRFDKGNYNISRIDPFKITGNGKLVINKATGTTRDWEGDLTFDEIRSISYSEPTIFGAVSTLFIVGLGAIIILLVAYPPRMN